MKTLQSKIAIALFTTTVFFNANAEDKLTTPRRINKQEATTSNSIFNYKMSNLNVGMYEVGSVNSLKLNLSMTKDEGKTATIKLMNEKGEILNEERIGKSATGYNFRYDFSNIEIGKYFIEITNGDNIITKEILKGKGTLSY